MLPAGWEGFQIRYRYGKSAYEIEVVNAGQGPARTIEVDERLLASDTFRLVGDGARHTVRLTLGARIPAQSHGTN